ncbi:MAG: hypothetical protein LBG12_08205 [Synergistaceae bacterium]|jgi:hypothetical protein|nr:hypothetical protein [Synergistaceae bacterium]
MIHNIPEPDISPNFTIDDIHKMREWNYERLKDATIEEHLADINKGAENTRRAIEEIRRKNALKAG